MPRIALISPKKYTFAHNEDLSNFFFREPSMRNIRNIWSAPNLGLLTIAALIPSNWEVDYIDEYHREIDFNVEYNIVVLSCMTQQIDRGAEIAQIYRSRNTLTVMGGIHATVCSQEVLKYCDVVFIGEAELTWPQFINDYLNHCYKRIYQEEYPGEYDIRNPILPRYDLAVGYPYSTITISTSRGCNHKCSFCAASTIYGSKYRRKTNEQILCEIKYIHDHFPDKYILFGDDNLFISKEECKKLLQMIEPLQIKWIAQTDISIADDSELLKLMYKAGCMLVLIGLESIQKNNLSSVEQWKADRIERYRGDISTIQNNGIGVIGSFVFGLPNDTVDSMNELIAFIDSCNFFGIHVTTPTPFPGSSFYNEISQKGRLLSKSWSYYTQWDVVIEPEQLTVEQLQSCVLVIYKSFLEKRKQKERFRGFIKMLR